MTQLVLTCYHYRGTYSKRVPEITSMYMIRSQVAASQFTCLHAAQYIYSALKAVLYKP